MSGKFNITEYLKKTNEIEPTMEASVPSEGGVPKAVKKPQEAPEENIIDDDEPPTRLKKNVKSNVKWSDNEYDEITVAQDIYQHIVNDPVLRRLNQQLQMRFEQLMKMVEKAAKAKYGDDYDYDAIMQYIWENIHDSDIEDMSAYDTLFF